jgi:hypothetical protein
MQQTLRQKIDKYRYRYIVPMTFWTKKENGVLKGRVDITPTLTDVLLFFIMVGKEVIIHLVLFTAKFAKGRIYEKNNY